MVHVWGLMLGRCFYVWSAGTRHWPAFFPSSLRKHVCVLQSAAAKQTGTDIHGASCSQRCAGSRVNGGWIPVFPAPLLPASSSRLQQDIQSEFGRVPADLHAAPSSLHPHRSVGHSLTHTHTHTPQHSYSVSDQWCFHIQVTTSWCICRDTSFTVSTPGSRRCSATLSFSLVSSFFAGDGDTLGILTNWAQVLPNWLDKPLGADADLDLRSHPADMVVLHAEEESVCGVLDLSSGRIHMAEVDPDFLLQILQSDAPSKWVCFKWPDSAIRGHTS